MWVCFSVNFVGLSYFVYSSFSEHVNWQPMPPIFDINFTDLVRYTCTSPQQQTSLIVNILYINSNPRFKGHHGHDRMVVGFITTCAISAYHH